MTASIILGCASVSTRKRKIPCERCPTNIKRELSTHDVKYSGLRSGKPSFFEITREISISEFAPPDGRFYRFVESSEEFG